LDKYTLPREIGPAFPAGYVTQRYTPAQIATNVNQTYGIPNQIVQAFTKFVWSQFNNLIIRVHDNGHVSCGETMAQQDVAVYDPIFWFFHANLDRLWWKWQQTASATDLAGFLTTVKGSTDWLKTPPFNSLPPFQETTDQSIDLAARGVDYAHPTVEMPAMFAAEAFGSLPAAALTGIRTDKASVRIKGIDRLNIPGSFTVRLQAGDETIASQAFFQARDPRSCSACVKQGKLDLDLEAGIDQLKRAPLRVTIQPMWPGAIGATFP
jgi:tyrosinase